MSERKIYPMISHTDIQIARQGALMRAIEYSAQEAPRSNETAGRMSPDAIMALAIQFEDHLLDVDRINKHVMECGAIIDFPTPEPTPVAPAAPSAPPAAAPPPVPTSPLEGSRNVAQVIETTALDAPRYAGQKCPWHAAQTRTSKHNPDSYYCADRDCKWQMRIFDNKDGTKITKWLASADSGWLDAAEFDAQVGGPA